MDPLSCARLIVLIAIAVFLFYLSLIEKSLLLTNPYKLQIKADEGNKRAKNILRLLDKVERPYATIMILTVASYVASSILLYYLFAKCWPSLNFITIVFIDFGTIIIFSSIFLKLIPFSIARNIPDTITSIFYFPLFILTYLLLPLSLIYEGLSFLLRKKEKMPEEVLDEDELTDAVEQISDDGLIEEEQEEIIQSVFDFDNTNVKEILTPRNKIFAIDVKELTHEKIKEIILKYPYSRIPVYDGDFDNFIGILLIKTYFKEVNDNPDVDLLSILQKPYFVSSRIMIDDLFDGFKKHHTHIALVRDNKKQIIGMVTMEDVLEELVDNISEPQKQGGKSL